jgi:hypothetical protein
MHRTNPAGLRGRANAAGASTVQAANESPETLHE